MGSTGDRNDVVDRSVSAMALAFGSGAKQISKITPTAD